LATIQKIKSLSPIEGADKIELAELLDELKKNKPLHKHKK
jgi:hypothetical protein